MKALHKAAIIMKIALRFRKAIFGAPSGTRTQDPLIKSQLLSQMTQTKPILKSVQTSFIALSSLFHVKLDFCSYSNLHFLSSPIPHQSRTPFTNYDSSMPTIHGLNHLLRLVP